MDYKRNRARRRWRPAKRFSGDDQFGRPFSPYLAPAMSAYIEAAGLSPPLRWRILR